MARTLPASGGVSHELGTFAGSFDPLVNNATRKRKIDFSG